MVNVSQIEHFQQHGYCIARGLYSPQEVAFYRSHFMELRAGQEHPGDFVGVPRILGNSPKTGDLLYDDRPDPLKQYPRMIHMHRWDEVSLKWLIDARINEHLTAFLGSEPYAVQTMLYFKPPGARGQALHQDQYYLKVQPGTCIAAWLPLDDCDEENGCLQVVPGSQNWDVLCPVQADTTQSFTSSHEGGRCDVFQRTACAWQLPEYVCGSLPPRPNRPLYCRRGAASRAVLPPGLAHGRDAC
jgi:phytanoyl-CoA hydroxylase